MLYFSVLWMLKYSDPLYMEGQTALGLAAAVLEASPKKHHDLQVFVCENFGSEIWSRKFFDKFHVLLLFMFKQSV